MKLKVRLVALGAFFVVLMGLAAWSRAQTAVVPNPVPEPVRRSSAPGETALAERDAPDREATDSKAWPSA